MNKYGKAAIEAVKLIHSQSLSNPKEAWEAASSQIFSEGTSSQKKGCPRNAFLGLCEEGLVNGVKPGKYTNSKKNKQYAIDLVNELRAQPELVNDPTSLWKFVMRGDPKVHNHQMDVVIALWVNGFIE
jgi:hypothetical protein